jgi:O-succinylbenzoic acid--CoA ligase
MDAPLLIDPGFWQSSEPFVAGTRQFDSNRFPELAGHVLFQTSGSTGTPKWIALSKDALLLSAAAVNRHLAVDEYSRWGLALPLHHVGGFGVAARAFEAACAMERYVGKWNPQSYASWLEKYKVSHSSLVPTQVHDLVVANLPAPNTIKAIVVGGGLLPTHLGVAARSLGWPVLASYGMTEAGSQIATQSLDELESSYRHSPLPLLPIWEASVDDESRLSIAGPALFSGSVRQDGTTWKFEPRHGKWHVTSDLAKLNDRRVTPLGRADTKVKVLGELVDPVEIEQELERCSGNRLRPGSFAVAAVPDERAGHRLVAVFATGVPPELAETVLASYHQQAAGPVRLSQPIWIEEIPVGDLGKINRTALRRLIVG